MSSAICISTNSSPHSINISDQDVETRRRWTLQQAGKTILV
jgi:hypothetical protein